MSLVDRIIHLKPCEEAADWLDGYSYAQSAWLDSYMYHEWQCWFLERSDVSLKALASCFCEIMRLGVVTPRMEDTIRVVERWISGGDLWPMPRHEIHKGDNYPQLQASTTLYSLCGERGLDRRSLGLWRIATAALGSNNWEAGWRAAGHIVLKHFPLVPSIRQST